MTALEDVRVEIAFSSDPSSTDPTWNDLTSRARLDGQGISISRGRLDEFGGVSPGSLTVGMDNTDGVLTPGNASSPYYPYVKPNNRVRVTYRDPSVDGNFVDAESATFEGGTVGSWAPGGTAPPTLAASTTQAHSGTYSLRVTWATGGSFPLASYAIPKLIMGRVYTASLWVYVPSGSPVVTLVLGGEGVFGSGSTTNDAWERISVTWTASMNNASLQLWPATSPTAGDLVYMDEAQVDEGSTVRTFTTTAPPITYRFDGFVESWPVSWPLGGKEESVAALTAYDLQSRLSRAQGFGTVIDETYREIGDLAFHYPLDESGDSVTAVTDITAGKTLDVIHQGMGGEVSWGNATGPGTDDSSAPTFTPSSGEGYYLRGLYPFGTSPSAVQAASVSFSTTASTDQVVLELLGGGSDQRIAVGVDSSGDGFVEQSCRLGPSTSGTTDTITSSSALNDGETHHIAVVSYVTSSQWTVDVYIDGVSAGSTDVGSYWTGSQPPLLGTMHVANGIAKDSSGWTRGIWSGSVSHVAGWTTDPGSSGVADAYEACTDGFAGETVVERIQRIAEWINLDSSFLDLDASTQTMGHVNPAGMTPWEYMALCGEADGGSLYVSADGKVTLRNRSKWWDLSAATDVTVTADEIGPDVGVPTDLQRLVNRATVSRSSDGASATASSASSISAYGEFGLSISLGIEDAAELAQRAGWLLNTNDTPRAYIPGLSLDALTATYADDARAVDLDSRIAIGTMPSQSPISSGDLRVLGYTETINAREWTVSCNTVPFLAITPLTLDDATYGVLGTSANNRLAL